MRWRTLVLAGLLIGAVSLHPTSMRAEEAAAVQDLVFLGKSFPVRIRLRIFNGGKPFRERYREAWGAYNRTLFAHLDRDGDGALTEAEARRMPSPPRLGQLAGLSSPVNVAFNFLVVDEDADGKVTPVELAAFHDLYAGGPFQAEFRARDNSLTAAAGQALFTHLDADKDKALSPGELDKALAVLRKLDIDGDDLWTAPELLGRGGAPVAATAMGPLSREPSRFLILTPDSRTDLARQLLRLYGSPSSPNHLSPETLNLNPAALARLDRDRDGKLNADELVGYAALDADLEVRVNLGSRKRGQSVLEVVREPGGKGLHVAEGKDGTLTLAGEGIRLAWRFRPAVPAVREGARQQRLAEFRAALGRTRKALTPRDVRREDFFPDRFGLLDRDQDGRLTAKELEGFLDGVHRAQADAIAAAAGLEVSARGEGLFDLLDHDQDGRLGVREVRSAGKLLDAKRPGGPRALALGSLPQVYYLSLGLGRGNLGGGADLGEAGLPLLPLSWDRQGLVWFTKMDRNRDGDVSVTEFLGTPGQFRRLDADGDGLLDRAEAARAAELFPAKK